MLSAKNLKITFNPGTPIETRALRGLSLDIPAGQFVTVIGSNGAGKSTFLNAVSGDLPIDSGQILIDDEDVTRKPVWARANRVARVFQDPMAGTCEDLTIEENMALAQRRGAGRGLGRAVQASITARIVAEKKLTTMMVTHSMRQALDVGERTVMLHQGQVVLDVSGEQRKGLDVPDLLAMFEKVRGEKLADDALLLG
ncbi:ABC transporter ATP-binding protein [Pseudomonas aeruginosa]|uniref:ABC transporter ATP-binding protein n=1 Tax=Pseudomonas aeruginosa TaxID=287 RepID=UPI000BBD4695|nr:ATP-binding cassette domain-containing protein [Pseudomonas aeruginosa]PCK63964.1 hypothetical protein A2J11_24735 [Pseudomonas aeruginosa]